MPFYPGPAGRRARPARGRRRARRGPLRPAARLRARAGRRGRALVAPRCSGCRSPAPTTPSSAAYARLRSGDPRVAARRSQLALGAFYGALRRGALAVARRPTRALARARHRRRARSARWDRGVDVARFSPGAARPGARRRGAINVLYAGRLTPEKGVDLLADAFLAARGARPAPAPRARRRRARGGARCARRLGARGDVPRLARGRRARAAPTRRADLFLFCSQTDTFGQVVLEAQASGLPGRRGRRGRPRRADRRRPQRPALPAADAGARPTRVAGLAGSRRAARAARPRRAGRGARAHLGGLARPRSAAGWRRALASGAPRTAGGRMAGADAAWTRRAADRGRASTTSSRRPSSAAR